MRETGGLCSEEEGSEGSGLRQGRSWTSQGSAAGSFLLVPQAGT